MYSKEREGLDTIEEENGFLTYRALPSEESPQEYRIYDLYVRPEFRKSGLASQMADRVVSLAKQNGCKILTGSVDTRANGATVSVKVLLSYGFKVLRTEGPMIYFVMEVD
jgi:ribosomal protein S18 acetylase RimI-like enzyme